MIKGIDTHAVVVPMRRPLRTGGGAVTEAPLLLIDLHTSEGVTGHAYLFGIQRFTLRPLASMVESMAEMIAGMAVAPLDVDSHVRRRVHLLGAHNITGLALAGIDMALWDALARMRGVPLASLLGSAPRPIAAYNSNGLGIMPPEDAALEAAQLVNEGFRAIKIRLGRPSSAEDVAAVRAVRRSIPDDVMLMSDFNQSLSGAEAMLRAAALDGEGLYWIEEPVRCDDYGSAARIAAAVRTPIQIGENFSGVFQMQDAIAARACDYVMPDAQRIGGVTGWMRAAALAHAAGLEMSSHLFPEISAHLLAATPTCHWLEFVDWASPILREPMRPANGAVVAPDRPGIGIEWDMDAVRRYSIF